MKKFAAPEGQVLPVLSLCLSSRLEKVLGAGLPAVDLNEAMLGKDVGILEILPSGKLTQLWKITIFNWKIHYKWPFSIAMLVYQRVEILPTDKNAVRRRCLMEHGFYFPIYWEFHHPN